MSWRCSGRTHRALRRHDVAAHHLFGEVAATGLPAGAAIGFGQQFLDLLDARIFEDVEFAIGEGQQPRQGDPEHGHETTCHRQTRHRFHETARPPFLMRLIDAP